MFHTQKNTVMKRIIFPLLALFTCVCAQSQIIDVNGIYYRLVQDTTAGNNDNIIAAVTTMGETDHYQGSISIPSSVSYNGTDYTVAAIADMAFKGCKQLTSVAIPASVTQIPSGLFYGCSNLTTITVAPENSVFDSREGCNAIIRTSTNTIIAGCKNSTFPTSVSTIGECAFYGCMGITSFTIPSNISIIESWAFLDCSGLLSLNVPPTVTEFGTNVFLGCNNIQTLEWNSKYSPALVAGQSYPSLKSVVLGDEVTILLPYTFSNCTALESVELSPNLTRISQYAFKNCNSLTSISFPSGLNFIDSNAFQGCDNIETVYWNFRDSIAMSRVLASASANIKKVIIGKDVTCIEGRAFSDFTNLTSIEVDPANKVYDSRQNCNAVIEKETNTLIVGCKGTVIPEGVTRLEEYSFMWCGGPVSVSLPSSLLSIGSYAFCGCEGITSLFIPKNVTDIGSGITAYCPDITSIKVDPENRYYSSPDNCNAIINTLNNTLVAGCKESVIPSGVKRIGDYAFDGCSGLTTLTTPAGLTDIGDFAFNGCSGLKSVDISKGVTNVGSYAFSECIGLTSVITPTNMERIGNNAFFHCSNLLSFTIPDGIKIIERGLFSSCESIVTIEIPASVDSIERSAFEGCMSLRSVTIPEGVTTIEDYTFSNCQSLEYLSIPSTVTNFGRNIYDYCISLKSAGPQGGGYNFEYNWKDTIPANAFYSLYDLESVYIPKTIKAVYEYDNRYGRLYYNDDYPSSVFPNCNKLKSIAVSFTDTKLIRLFINPMTGYTRFIESPMDYNLYKYNPIESLTLLDDTVKTFTDILTNSIKEVVFSEYVKDIYPGVFNLEPYTIIISDNSQKTFASLVENINVEGGNPAYSSVNGVLFNKDQSELLAYPAGREGRYRIPSSTTSIAEYAFSGSIKLTEVNIPNSVTRIGEKSFMGCDTLLEVVIEGAPSIGLHAFDGCRNIQSVRTRSIIPGIMELAESPQTIMVGECAYFPQRNFNVKYQYDAQLGRMVSLIYGPKSYYGNESWRLNINATDIPSGTYRISVGILPSPDGLLNAIHPTILGYKYNVTRGEALLDSMQELDVAPFFMPAYYYNDGNAVIRNDTTIIRPGRYNITKVAESIGYDSVLIAESLFIPEGFDYLSIRLEVYVDDYNINYSHSLFLDRIFFEPIDEDMSTEMFAGPFTQNVFNNATLYVPQDAIDTYRNAEGWKLFRNIQADDKVYPAKEIEVTVTDAGYATFYYSDGDYMLPEGLKAMVISDVTPEGQLIYNTIADGNSNGIIPAGTAVVLATHNRQAGVFRLQLSSSMSYDGQNLLIGSDVATTTYAPGNSLFYKLSYGPSNTSLSKVPGWYWATADGGAFGIEAHKAWLAISYSLTRGAAGYSLDGNPTNVSGLQSGLEEIIIYDLYGRRINAPSGNGISIRNGQKIIIIE